MVPERRAGTGGRVFRGAPGAPIPPPRHRQCAANSDGPGVPLNGESVNKDGKLQWEKMKVEIESEISQCMGYLKVGILSSWKLDVTLN